MNKPFPENLSKPVQRALLGAGYTKLTQLTKVSENELMKLHGMGPKAIAQIKKDLKAIGKSLAQPKNEKSPIDAYLKTLPKNLQAPLQAIRLTVRKVAPEAVEYIGYGMPGFKLNGKPLVYFAAWKEHVGFYPLPSGMTAFSKELAKYKVAKGSAQFPLDKPMPLSLITKIVKFRVKENAEKAKK